VHLRVRLEPQYCEFGDFRRYQVQVDVGMHPQSVRRHIGAEHNVAYRRVAIGQFAGGRGTSGEDGDHQIGRVLVQERAKPRHELAACPGVGHPGELAAGPKRGVMERVVQAWHSQHRAEYHFAGRAGAVAHHLHGVQRRRRPALRFERRGARGSQCVVAHAD